MIITPTYFMQNKNASAISSPSATCLMRSFSSRVLIIASTASLLNPASVHNSVFTQPGETTFTRTGARSTASPRVRASTEPRTPPVIAHPLRRLMALVPARNRRVSFFCIQNFHDVELLIHTDRQGERASGSKLGHLSCSSRAPKLDVKCI